MWLDRSRVHLQVVVGSDVVDPAAGDNLTDVGLAAADVPEGGQHAFGVPPGSVARPA